MSETTNFSQQDKYNSELALKQFFLETERLELTYRSLEAQFKSTQMTLYQAQSQLGGKMAELSFATSYLDAILSHISQGLFFIDLNGIITTYNSAAEDVFGIEATSALMHSFGENFSDAALGFSLKEALITKRCPKINFISWINPKTNKAMEIEIESTFVRMNPHLCPMPNQKHSSISIQGLLILARNITEVRQLQILASRNDRLKELGEIAARVAHEIRNPLSGIKGFATFLQQDLADRPELQHMASQIVQGTNQLSLFVSNILTYARPMQPHFEALEMVTFLKDVLAMVQVDGSLNPQTTCQFNSLLTSLIVPVDPALLKSALLNLLVNGLQAMPNGGVLTVELEKEAEEAVIRIQDTGVGISEMNLNKIFSPFFTTKECGNGLGLSEVYKVIQTHHGTIEVQSEVGKGTLFTIKIPLKA